MKHVVMFSGGVGSWATAKLVAKEHGTEDLVLLFADTAMEDQDLYRFIEEGAANVGGEFVQIIDGRDIWQVFIDNRFLGNSRRDPCSKFLKRVPMRKWLEANCDPADTVVYIGIDWTESHRFENAKSYWEPWECRAPLCDPPYLDKEQVLDWLKSEGIEPPRLYALGFAHNNCGGGCVKAGMSQFRLLLEKLPERYAWWETEEQKIREFLGKDVAILTDRSGPVCTRCGLDKADESHVGEEPVCSFTNRRPLTLREFRLRVQGGDACDTVEDGSGCACLTPDGFYEEPPIRKTIALTPVRSGRPLTNYDEGVEVYG